jgi:Leucine-rich repeat (LRR) protein
MNQLTSVPAELGNLAALTLLNLDDNQLRSVPKELGGAVLIVRPWVDRGHTIHAEASQSYLSSLLSPLLRTWSQRRCQVII